MAPLIGKEMVESLFLERFATLCLDPLFHVRKVCAANFGDFSSVVGSESTESVLVSTIRLPNDLFPNELCLHSFWNSVLVQGLANELRLRVLTLSHVTAHFLRM